MPPKGVLIGGLGPSPRKFFTKQAKNTGFPAVSHFPNLLFLFAYFAFRISRKTPQLCHFFSLQTPEIAFFCSLQVPLTTQISIYFVHAAMSKQALGSIIVLTRRQQQHVVHLVTSTREPDVDCFWVLELVEDSQQ